MSSIGSNNGSSKKVPGVLWDDLGATNFVTSGAGPSKSKSTDHNAKRKALVDKMRQSSDDELDFLSSGSLSEDADVAASKKERKSKKQHSEKVIVDGQELTYHPNFFPQRKLPDFKKKKDSTAAEEQSSSASRTPKPSKIAKQYSVLAALHNNENTILSASSSDAGHVEDVFPQSGRKIRNFPGLTLSPLRADKQEKSRPDKSHREGEKKTTASASKLSRSSKTSSDKSDADSRRALPSRKPSRMVPSDRDDSDGATPRPKQPKSRKPRGFPSLEPLSISSEATQKPAATRKKATGKGTHTSSMPSKVVTPRRDRGAGFPSLSPLSSPVEALPRRKSHVGSSKGSNFADSSTDEDSDGPPSKGKSRLQPFPMLASQPQPISHSPYTGSSYKPRVVGERDLFADDLGELADDSLFIDQSADPSTLCPFCDEKLPPNPSPLYHTLLDAAKRKASPDPRPTNTRGLRAKMGIYIASCQRHRFEAHQVPKAIAKGWPTAINFGGVRERVEKLSGDLARLVNGEGEARNQCIYWTTVMKEVQKIGSRAATGVKGQFENFEKTQPGYYGELGSMILHQTLYNMFPPSSFDAQAIMPLTPQEFIQRILVPEAALALIMEDTGQDRVRAAQTMRDSAAYGVAMFPDTSEGPGIGAGEDIVLERARVRRRELDAEEEIEAQLRTEEEEAEQSTKSKGTKRPKKLASTTTTDIEETSARRKFKRTKAGSRTDVEKPEESATLESSPPSVRRSTRTASRSSSVAPQPDLSSPQLSMPRSRGGSRPPRSSPPGPAPSSKPNSRAAGRKPTRAPEDQQHERLHTASDMDVESDAPRKSSASRLKKNGSIHAPIDVDAQVIEIFDTPSPSEHSSPIPAEVPRSRPRPRRVEPGAQESSGAENPAAENDIATPKPKKPHARPLKGGAPASRSGAAPKGAISALLAQEGRESSVEVIEPPQNRKPTAWRSRMADPLNDTSDEGSVQARSSPVGRSRPGRDHNNDWLLDDSSD